MSTEVLSGEPASGQITGDFRVKALYLYEGVANGPVAVDLGAGVQIPAGAPLRINADVKLNLDYSWNGKNYKFDVLFGPVQSEPVTEAHVYNSLPGTHLVVGWGIASGNRPSMKTTFGTIFADNTVFAIRIVKNSGNGTEKHYAYNLEPSSGNEVFVRLHTSANPFDVKLDPQQFVEITSKSTIGQPQPISGSGHEVPMQHLNDHAANAGINIP